MREEHKGDERLACLQIIVQTESVNDYYDAVLVVVNGAAVIVIAIVVMVVLTNNIK